MKDERNVRHHRAAGARWRPAAILLAAVLLAVSVPFFGKSVFAADPGPVHVYQNCSLTVSSTGFNDQDGDNVIVDLYRVAYLIPDDAYDTYHWAPTSALDGLITLPEDTDRDGWMAKAEELAGLILGEAPEGATQWNPMEGGGLLAENAFTDISEYSGQPDDTSYMITGKKLGEKIPNIPSGFYLIVAHGKDIDQYVFQESDEQTVTLAMSEKYRYQFAAELRAVPTKDKVGDEINTANPGGWIYDSTVGLKPDVRERSGSLVIIKDLELYEYRKKEVGDNPRDIKDNATFVFEVSAYENEDSYDKENEEVGRIYHNYISINFNDESGSKNAIVKDFPVGTYVRVKEVYSGRSYTETVKENNTETDNAETAVIQPDDVAYVDFENKYDKTQGGGGSFVNNFKFTEKEGNETGWEGNRVDDNSTGSTVVKPFNKD